MRIFWLLGLAALAGCSSSIDIAGSEGEGDGTISAYCNTLDGSVAPATGPVCYGCTIQNPQNVSDDSPYSYATMVASSTPQQSVRITANALEGLTYPAGGHAGAFLTAQTGGTHVSVADGVTGEYAIRTYLDGAMQESAGDTIANSLNTQNFPGGNDLPHEYVYFVTSKPYDAVEIVIWGEGVSVPAPEYRVYALCSDGNISR